ncbi:MAG: hypothetical protein HY900_17125 [Deltaproteobacteria bacterium]|nr:hypothetical protein [Deltaproteobacteria bacterium]
MKKTSFGLVLCLLVAGLPPLARADLASFLNSVNVQARADLGAFNVKLSAQFGVPVTQVETIVRSVEAPADAFMCLQLAEMSHKPPETVLVTYQKSKGKGWGAIAKELGIKPGSPEFHALKRGDLAFTGESGGGGKGKSKDKGKGKKK